LIGKAKYQWRHQDRTVAALTVIGWSPDEPVQPAPLGLAAAEPKRAPVIVPQAMSCRVIA
jgi:hypothetical protein